MKINQKYSVIIIITVAIVLFFACYLFYKNNHKITLSTEQQQQVNQLLGNSATRCVGVYLIDLPIDFKTDQVGQLYYQDNDVIISTQQQYLPPFKQMVALREQELKNTKPIDSIDGDFLKAIYPVSTDNPDKMQGIIFERMEDITIPDVARILEGYRWQDEVTLKIEMKANNGLAQRYDEDRATSSPGLYDNNVPKKLNEINKLFERISVLDDLTIPTEPGFCFTNVFMKGENREHKDMNFIYQYDGNEDFYFSIDSEDQSYNVALLDIPAAFIMPEFGKTIYKGTRKSKHLSLEEWITKGKYFEDNIVGRDFMHEGYIFTLGIHMVNSNYRTPKLVVKMFYKIPIDKRKAYTEEQLMVIWQRITDSIRIRESSFEN
ncbi:T6SS immunity protein Tli4 family protein [uncultured Gilliamella sp.]|uniref:T6SS immunity protein Tli4 family protein n=1 Tax=uncultured Gilliamella sp. TaxID=1193505 RepID=UPI0025FAC9E5|nr:T6SS immunity protein Tli4 family protein [uncultured Gilliamella sp.]